MELEETVWKQIIQLWNNPRLLPPILHEETSKAPDAVKHEIAGHVYQDRQIHINLENLCKELGNEQGTLHAVACHEAGHHALIPYSPAISLRLIMAANKILEDWQKSLYVENIFDDMILNTYIVQNSEYFGKELIKALASMKQLKNDKFGKLYLLAYEKLWNLPPETLVPNAQHLASDANKIARILSDSTFAESTWQEKITFLAEIVKPYLAEEKCCSCRVRKPGETGDIEQALQQIAREKNLREFQEMGAGLGLGTPKYINEQYYLGHARKYSIKLPETRTMTGDLYPDSPKTWLPSDHTSRLNIPYTLQMFGKIIPGVTTRQWEYKKGVAWQQSKEARDVLIILDSSGSMPKPDAAFSRPVLASYVVAESALDAGSKAAVINFSDKSHVVPYTHDKKSIRKGLGIHYNGGTIFPCSEFLNILNSTQRKQHIFMISDGYVGNEQEWLAAMQFGIQKASGTLFLAGVPGDIIKQLEAIGYRVHPLQSNDDLVRITEAESHELYG